MIRMLITAALVALALAAAASAGNPDPRKCSTNTGSDQSRHAYYCARAAAIQASRVAMARAQNVARWFPSVSCSQKPSLLRWSCLTSSGGMTWALTVTFRATHTGWHTYVARTP